MRSLTPGIEKRSGFTLIELLVVISILLILMVMTVSAVSYTLNDEKVGSAARQVQSFLEGARSRAIRAKEPRGVRFYRDAELGGANMVTTMAYVAPGELWDEGTIRMERISPFTTAVSTVIAGNIDTFWWELHARQQLYPGLRIKIPNSASGSWYTVTALNAAITTGSAPPTPAVGTPYPLQMTISPAFRDPATAPTGQQIAFSEGGPQTYALELPPRILPRQPVLLPDNTCIDELISNNVPPAHPAGTHFDLMFSPRGTVIGSAASAGLIHFYMGEVTSALSLRDAVISGAIPLGVPADDLPLDDAGDGTADTTEPVGRRSLVTVFTQTGSIVSNPVRSTDALINATGASGADGLADDPYLYAETAGKPE